MSEIVKFILDNISKLNALDFGLILATAAVLSYGAYKLLSGLFQKRHEAQDDLLRLKEDVISTYQRQVQLIENERTKLEAIAVQRAQDIDDLRKHLLASAIQEKFSQEHINRIVRNTYALRYLLLRDQQLLGALGMCGSLKSMFAVYLASGANDWLPNVLNIRDAFAELRGIDTELVELGQQLKQSIDGISSNPTDSVMINDEGYDTCLSSLNDRIEKLDTVFIKALGLAFPGAIEPGSIPMAPK